MPQNLRFQNFLKTSVQPFAFSMCVIAACQLAAGCKARGYNDNKGSVKAIPFVDEVAEYLRVTIVVTPPDSNKFVITGVKSVSRFIAGKNERPGCVEKDLPESSASAHDTPTGKMREFFNKSKIEDSKILIDLPLKIGRVLNYCGYSRTELPEIEVSGLDAHGVFFQFRLRADVQDKLTTAPQNIGIEYRALVRTDQKGDTLAAPSDVAIFTSRDPFVTVSFASFPTASPAVPAQLSFADVWKKIENSKLDPKNLPSDVSVSEGRAAVGVFSHSLGTDAASDIIKADQLRTLTLTSDEKKAGRKALHPFGMCAKGVWKVTGTKNYSGLFRPGTSVPAILRFSANGAHTLNKPEYGLVNHMYAVAVKLYPGDASQAPLESRNVLLFDDQGYLGNKSPYFLFNSPSKNTQFFANWGYGTNAVSNGSLKMFDKLVYNTRLAPLTKVAMQRADGQYENSSEFKSPQLIKVWHTGPFKTAVQKDLRQDLMQYGDSEIKLAFALYDNQAQAADLTKDAAQVDGEITSVSAPVLSSYCDEQLQFYHSAH